MPVIKLKALFKGRRKVKVRDLSSSHPTVSNSEGKNTKEVEVIKEKVPSLTRAIGCSIVSLSLLLTIDTAPISHSILQGES